MQILQMLQIGIMVFAVVMNLIGFCVMGMDKIKARKHRRRVPERRIFIISILLGSVGVLAGMYIFRHKTRHMKFVIGIPVILAAQIIVWALLTYGKDFLG